MVPLYKRATSSDSGITIGCQLFFQNLLELDARVDLYYVTIHREELSTKALFIYQDAPRTCKSAYVDQRCLPPACRAREKTLIIRSDQLLLFSTDTGSQCNGNGNKCTGYEKA